MMPEVSHQVSIPAELDGKRLDRALAAVLPDYSRERIKRWILDGHVLLDGDLPQPRSPVRAGQCVELRAALEDAVDDAPQPIPLSIVYEDASLMVIDKPAGLVVHPGAGNRAGTLLNGLLHRAPELSQLPRAGLLHRLDKDTSGLLLVARSLAAHTRLTADLEARRIRREYRAICTGAMTAGGEVDAPVGRHATRRTRMAVSDRGRPAVTHYRVLLRFPAHALIAARLETGRTHQIRVHMAHIGHALVGDPVYGGRLQIPAGASAGLREALQKFRRQALHASRLAFRHPEGGRPMTFTVPLPPDFVALLGALDGRPRPPAFYNQLSWPGQ